jgi:hypothetical protein
MAEIQKLLEIVNDSEILNSEIIIQKFSGARNYENENEENPKTQKFSSSRCCFIRMFGERIFIASMGISYSGIFS